MLVEQKGAMRQATVSSLDTEGDSSALELQIRLVGGIGVSVINSVPEELVFINLEQIQVFYSEVIIIGLMQGLWWSIKSVILVLGIRICYSGLFWYLLWFVFQYNFSHDTVMQIAPMYGLINQKISVPPVWRLLWTNSSLSVVWLVLLNILGATNQLT